MTLVNDQRDGGGVEDFNASPHERLWGSGNIEKMFPEGVAKVPSPFGVAAGRKGRTMYQRDVVLATLKRKPELAPFDPRHLKGVQSSVTRQGVQYYMGDQWRQSGQTFADQTNEGNRYPFVYHRRTDGLEHILLAGHHRAAAALLKGEMLEARHAEGTYGP
jgi:hypothetical protein